MLFWPPQQFSRGTKSGHPEKKVTYILVLTPSTTACYLTITGYGFFFLGAYWSLPDAAIWWCLRTGGGGDNRKQCLSQPRHQLPPMVNSMPIYSANIMEYMVILLLLTTGQQPNHNSFSSVWWDTIFIWSSSETGRRKGIVERCTDDYYQQQLNNPNVKSCNKSNQKICAASHGHCIDPDTDVSKYGWSNCWS